MHSSSDQLSVIIELHCFPVYVICRTGSGYSCYLCRWAVHGERFCWDEQYAENNCRLCECCQEGGFLSLDCDQTLCDTVLYYKQYNLVPVKGWWASCGAGAPLFPPCPFTSSSFPLFTFPFFHWLYLFSSFVHPFPFYQNSPTLFPGRRS